MLKTAVCVCMCVLGKRHYHFFFLHDAFFDLLLKSGACERLGRTSKRAGFREDIPEEKVVVRTGEEG